MQIPVGVLTDRDIVVKVVCAGVDVHAITVADVMTPEPFVARNDTDTSTVLEQMRWLGVRRVPVVSRRGDLMGVVSIDDIVDRLAAELADVAGSLRGRRSATKGSRPSSRSGSWR
jgi:predicted transcriptional regulator